jgi:hypothetical protein
MLKSPLGKLAAAVIIVGAIFLTVRWVNKPMRAFRY